MALTFALPSLTKELASPVAQVAQRAAARTPPGLVEIQSKERHRAVAAGALVLGAGFCRSQARKSKRCRLQAASGASEVKESVPTGQEQQDRGEKCGEDDRLVRYLGGNVSVRAISAKGLVQRVTEMHNCSPMAAIALGCLALLRASSRISQETGRENLSRHSIRGVRSFADGHSIAGKWP